MQTTWQKDFTAAREYPPLLGEDSADVAVVGGGLSGITCAYFLAKSGKSVVVLERGTLGESSRTAYTTAMITAQIDTKFADLQKISGPGADLVWRSGMDAIDEIERIVNEENIDCQFARVPAYIYGNSEREWAVLKKEAERAMEAGFPISLGKTEDLPFPNAGCYIFQNQAKFHPLRYCDGLRRAAERYGARFYENTAAVSVEGKNPAIVETENGRVSAGLVIVATYDPFNRPLELFAKKGMYLSYMIECRVAKGMLREALYVDGGNPYHYFRVDKGRDHDRLILGGEDHRREIKIGEEKNFEALGDYAEKILNSRDYKIETKWRGGILETWDGLPFIGPYSKKYPNRLVATGFSGNGMTYGTIAGRIFTDYVLGKKNPYARLYDPRRGYSLVAMFIKGRDYLGEFWNGAVRNIFRRRHKK